MSQGMALQQERACAAFDCADFSSSLASAGKQPRWRSFFQRCVLLLLVQSLLLGAAQAVPVAVVEPTTIPLHRTVAIGLSVGNPMGQPTGWHWPFASNLNASRSYDIAGRLTATEFGSYVYDAAGRITSLTQNLLQPGDSDPARSSIANASVAWSVRYDPAGRITGFDAPGMRWLMGKRPRPSTIWQSA